MELEHSNSVDPADPLGTTGDDVYSGAIERIPRFMVGLGLALAAVAWWRFGRSSALGLLGGSLVAFLNFQWLKNGVAGLADRVTNTGESKPGWGIVARFLVRYVLMGAIAYGILTSFPACLVGLFVGLLLPVGAIACEAAYEVYMVVTRRN